MPSDSDKPSTRSKLSQIEDFADLKSVVEAAVRQAKQYFEQAQEQYNEAEDRRTRSAQKEEDNQQSDVGVNKNKDMHETNREIALLAARVADQAKLAEEAAARAAEVIKPGAERNDMADLRTLVQQAQQTAKEVSMLADKTRLASDAVDSIGKLAAFDFIEDQRDLIFQRLEECDAIAKESGATTLFVAQSLPIINGIIYVGSRSQDNLNQALKWVHSRFAKADPQIVLSTLVFRYIADIGLAAYKGTTSTNKDTGEPREAIWTRISERVEKLRIK
jgi:hypothetical protein